LEALVEGGEEEVKASDGEGIHEKLNKPSALNKFAKNLGKTDKF